MHVEGNSSTIRHPGARLASHALNTRSGERLAMRILMLTNTYPPVLSGVARSVVAFDEEYRRRNHEVQIIAPEAEDTSGDDDHIVRVPAIEHFNGSEFPVPVPSPGLVAATVDEFRPDAIHAHHPFF